MKSILIVTNILLIGIIAFQACNSNKENETSSARTSSIPCNALDCKRYDTIPLQGVISGELLDTLSGAYFADVYKSYVSDLDNQVDPGHNPNTFKQSPGINFASGRRPDALSMFFDLEKIKNFIWKMEKSVCLTGCDTSIKLGIRFYYIKYPPNIERENELAGVPRGYRNMHALAMVPVYQKKSDLKWYDFYFNPNETTPGSCVFSRSLFDMLDGGFATFAVMGGDGDGTNHGGIGPPPNPGTFPTNEQ